MTKIPADIPIPTPVLLSYTEIVGLLPRHSLRLKEVPTEHLVSLALPTMRFGEPAYVWFAAPARRRPGEPMRLSPPDRWWALTAHGATLLLYARTVIVPMGLEQEAPASAEWRTPPGEDVTARAVRLRALEAVMATVSQDFFAGRPATAGAALAAELEAATGGAELAPFYRAMAPDFWAWLGPMRSSTNRKEA
jgi:hypothetical protein